MIRRIGFFLLFTIVGAAVFYLPMKFLIKEPPPEVIAWAAIVSVLPGLVVLFAAHRLREKPPEVKIVGVLLSTVFRMAAALGLGTLLYNAIPLVKEQVAGFVAWGVVFYLVTLFAETRLLYIDSSGFAPRPPGS